jgi:hypothetical protein
VSLRVDRARVAAEKESFAANSRLPGSCGSGRPAGTTQKPGSWLKLMAIDCAPCATSPPKVRPCAPRFTSELLAPKTAMTGPPAAAGGAPGKYWARSTCTSVRAPGEKAASPQAARSVAKTGSASRNAYGVPGFPGFRARIRTPPARAR